jgi:hypothetical protein
LAEASVLFSDLLCVVHGIPPLATVYSVRSARPPSTRF